MSLPTPFPARDSTTVLSVIWSTLNPGTQEFKMKMIISVTGGTDDPTRATLGMIAAKVAKDQGHDVTVWLQGEAATIANVNVYEKIVGHNMPPMKGLVEALVVAGVPLWVCEACGKGRNVGPDNFVATAKYMGMGDYVNAVVESDRSLSF